MAAGKPGNSGRNHFSGPILNMPSSTRQLKFLIVEDEALLAMDIEAIVEDCGHRVIAEAACLAEVEVLESIVAPDVALVDVQLANGSSGLDVCALIQSRWRNTVIVFLTANSSKLPLDLAGAYGVIAKPFSRNGLVSALQYIHEGVTTPPPKASRPESFRAAPAIHTRWAVRPS